MDRAELDRYLDDHPGSLVLLHSKHTDTYFDPDDETWRQAVVRELLVGRDRYLVLKRGPGHLSLHGTMCVPVSPRRASSRRWGWVMMTLCPPFSRKSTAASIFGCMLPGAN